MRSGNGRGRPRELQASGNLVRGLEAPCHSPGKQLPAFRLFCGVPPAKERRRQRTAAVHSPGHRPRGAAVPRTSRPHPSRRRPHGDHARHGAAAGPAHNGGPAWQIFTPLPRHPGPRTTLLTPPSSRLTSARPSGCRSRISPCAVSLFSHACWPSCAGVLCCVSHSRRCRHFVSTGRRLRQRSPDESSGRNCRRHVNSRAVDNLELHIPLCPFCARQLKLRARLRNHGCQRGTS